MNTKSFIGTCIWDIFHLIKCDLFYIVAVDGGYTEWSQWATCSVTCGGGTQERLRDCSNPPPSGGGADCTGLGSATDSQTCNDDPCAGE